MAGHCKHFSVIRPYLTEGQCHPEEGAYEMVNYETYKQHMNEDGQIEDDFQLRKVSAPDDDCPDQLRFHEAAP